MAYFFKKKKLEQSILQLIQIIYLLSSRSLDVCRSLSIHIFFNFNTDKRMWPLHVVFLINKVGVVLRLLYWPADFGIVSVRLLREELQLLQESGSYVGEVVKAMDKKKVLVKVENNFCNINSSLSVYRDEWIFIDVNTLAIFHICLG